MLPTILGHLFRVYGKVTSDQLERLQMYFWQPNNVPNILFNMIEELAFLADASDLPRTVNQIMNYGLDAIYNTWQYEDALIDWYDKPEQNKKWNNFKLHFIVTQQKLCHVRGDTMWNMPFHLENLALQEEVCQDFQCMNDEVVGSLNEMTAEVDNSNSASKESANAATRPRGGVPK